MKQRNKSRDMRKIKKLFSRAYAFIFALSCTFASTICAAADGEAAAGGVTFNTGGVNGLVEVIFGAAYCIGGAAGGIPSLIKLISGVSDGDERTRNQGIVGVLATVVGIYGLTQVRALFV